MWRNRGLAGPIRVHGMSQEDCDAHAAKDNLDHGCASSWPISARYLLHDCCQIRLKMNCMTVPCRWQQDRQAFVS